MRVHNLNFKRVGRIGIAGDIAQNRVEMGFKIEIEYVTEKVVPDREMIHAFAILEPAVRRRRHIYIFIYIYIGVTRNF